ncbi:hypothetical protein GALL_511390 [mine drainage metagenome]|uniref:Uncharacterized protein n=1 Tax=mine drainage metagenome TaxID=410659 RepID=A0A1J5PPQ3_9ZZZZ
MDRRTALKTVGATVAAAAASSLSAQAGSLVQAVSVFKLAGAPS